MKPRKLITLLIAVVMVATLIAACTPTQPSGETEPPKSAEVEATEKAADPTDAEEPPQLSTEPITFTSGGDYAADGVRDTVVTRALTEATGVTINQIKYDAEKMKVLAAGGDLPEIPKMYTTPDIETFVHNLIDQEALVPLTDLLEEYGQDLWAQAPLALTYSDQVFNNGNGIYVIPKAVVVPLETPMKNGRDSGFTVRWDVYKKIGAPELDTTEEGFIDCLKQMMEAYPTAPNGNKAWGISWFEDWGPYWPAGSWSSNTEWDRGHMVRSRTDPTIVQDGYLDPQSNFWATIRFFNKAYLAGVFDPDGLSMKWDQYSEKAKNGEILTGQANYMNPNIDLVGDPNAILVYAPGMSEYIPGVYQSEAPLGWNIANGFSISSNCSDPARALQWFNFLASDVGGRIHCNGKQGEDWDIVDGVPKLLGKRLDYVLSGGVENKDWITEEFGAQAFYLFGPPRQPHSRAVGDPYPYDLAQSYEYVLLGLTAGEKDFVLYMCDKYGYDSNEVRTPGEVYAKWTEPGGIMKTFPVKAYLGASFAPQASEEMQTIANECSSAIAEATARLVLAANEEAFYAEVDKLITQVKALGYEEFKADWEVRMQKSLETAQKLTQ